MTKVRLVESNVLSVMSLQMLEVHAHPSCRTNRFPKRKIVMHLTYVIFVIVFLHDALLITINTSPP